MARNEQFHKALAKKEDVEIVINIDDILVSDTYEGPVFNSKDDITSDNIIKLME